LLVALHVASKVEADSERISKEAEQCNAIAADAKADLDIAMPALEKVCLDSA
jgi:hypothetical protein